MAGHSKWANIKQKKGKTDAARGKLFTKIGRELTVAVKEGGPDPTANFKLRDIIAKARQNNMPNENIMRVIKRASGEAGGANFEEITYEGYGAGGVAVIVEALTDNRNRTGGDIRHSFDKYGGSLGQTGCVSYLFKRKGVVIVDRTISEDELILMALEAGADDVVTDDEIFEVYCAPNDLYSVAEHLKNNGAVILSQEIDMISDLEINPEGHVEAIKKMIAMLEENDDVQNVYHNAILPDTEED